MDNQRQSYQHQPIAQTDSRDGPKRGIHSEAFVRGAISRATFFSILRFCECLSLDEAVDLKNPHYKEVAKALKSWIPSMPPFRWLTSDYFGEGYSCLNFRETKSVVRFLRRA